MDLLAVFVFLVLGYEDVAAQVLKAVGQPCLISNLLLPKSPNRSFIRSPLLHLAIPCPPHPVTVLKSNKDGPMVIGVPIRLVLCKTPTGNHLLILMDQSMLVI
jgi:hypothetical protein